MRLHSLLVCYRQTVKVCCLREEELHEASFKVCHGACRLQHLRSCCKEGAVFLCSPGYHGATCKLLEGVELSTSLQDLQAVEDCKRYLESIPFECTSRREVCTVSLYRAVSLHAK